MGDSEAKEGSEKKMLSTERRERRDFQILEGNIIYVFISDRLFIVMHEYLRILCII